MKLRQRNRCRASETPPSPQPSPASGRGSTAHEKTAAPCSSPLPPAGEAAPQARVRVAHEVAKTEPLPRFGDATLAPTLSRQREREQSAGDATLLPGKAAHEKTAAPCSSPLPPAGEAAPQARVRVAHEVATTEPLPCSGDATLTPTLSRQREREQSAGDATLTPALSGQAEQSAAAQTRQLR